MAMQRWATQLRVRRGFGILGLMLGAGLGLGSGMSLLPAIAHDPEPTETAAPAPSPVPSPMPSPAPTPSAVPQVAPAPQPAPTPVDTTTLPIPSRAEVTRMPRADKFPLPAATRMPKDATIYLVNYTNAKIDYSVLGMTGESLLTGLLASPERSVTALPQLPMPLNLSLQRQDNGFMLVRPLVIDGDLYLTIDFAPTFELDTNYLNIKENGEIYLY